MGIEQKPNRLVAVLLGFLAVGLGQAHSGRWRRGGILALIAILGFPALLGVVVASGGTIAGSLVVIALGLSFSIWCLVDAAKCARIGSLPSTHKSIRVLIYLAYIIAYHGVVELERSVIKSQWVRAFVIPADSMAPALEPGDYILARMNVEPEVGDVVVFAEPRGGQLQVKRIVAGPGAVVEVDDESLLIDGAAQPTAPGPAYGPTTVGANEFFVLGDNRVNSMDSRHFGPIDRAAVLGRPAFVYFSYDLDGNGGVRWSRIGTSISKASN